jgi:uncharacterized protein (TIGR04255 family)
VIYSKNPLERVICQLRFPRILRVGVEEPSQFQDGVRDEYPVYEVSDESVQLPRGAGQVLARVGFSLSTGNQVHRFKSADERQILALSQGFLALEVKDYKRWEDFEGRLRNTEQVLRDTYNPAFYTRVGLRYQDVIRRSTLGLADVDWEELLNPALLGGLADERLSNQVQGHRCQVEIKLTSTEGVVRIRHGLVSDGSEQCYRIDADFFAQQEGRDTDGTFADLSAFNRLARYLFRWAITDTLHRAMGPEPLAESD